MMTHDLHSFRTLERRGHPFCAWAFCAHIVCTAVSMSPVCIVVQANSMCQAELAELSLLRGERDQLAVALSEARAQLARCNTAWDLSNQQTSQEARHPPKQPTSEVAKADDARPPQANLTAQPSPFHPSPARPTYERGSQDLASQGALEEPSRGGPSRSLQQAESAELHCSNADVKAVIAVAKDANKTNALLVNMTVTNAGCAECLRTCAKFKYRSVCLFRCQHQRENKCTDTTKIASLIPQATLQDRRWLVSMIEKVAANCAYCILETVESVGGAGCVQETMHITTDYPILPRPCLAELADVLKSKPRSLLLPKECSAPSRVTATADTDGEGVVQLNVPVTASPLDVACILAERFRRSENETGRNLATTLVVSAGIGPITMLADLFVNPGETVRIVAGSGTRAALALVVGERQLQVSAVAAVTEGSPSTPNCHCISNCVGLWSTAALRSTLYALVRYERVLRAGASRGHARARWHRSGQLNGQLGGVQRGAGHRH